MKALTKCETKERENNMRMSKENLKIKIENDNLVLGEICQDESTSWLNLFGMIEIDDVSCMFLSTYSQEQNILEYTKYTDGECQFIAIQMNDDFESEYVWISDVPFSEYRK